MTDFRLNGPMGWYPQPSRFTYTLEDLNAAKLAARLEEAEWWEHLAPDCGDNSDGDCMYCERLAEIRAEKKKLDKSDG